MFVCFLLIRVQLDLTWIEALAECIKLVINISLVQIGPVLDEKVEKISIFGFKNLNLQFYMITVTHWLVCTFVHSFNRHY